MLLQCFLVCRRQPSFATSALVFCMWACSSGMSARTVGMSAGPFSSFKFITFKFPNKLWVIPPKILEFLIVKFCFLFNSVCVCFSIPLVFFAMWARCLCACRRVLFGMSARSFGMSAETLLACLRLLFAGRREPLLLAGRRLFFACRRKSTSDMSARLLPCRRGVP